MVKVSWLCALFLCSAARLITARGGEKQLGAFQQGPLAGGVHEVHLRTGTIDVDAEHCRLPAPTPAARRLLQSPSPVPITSPEWGPLADAQLWLLTLGPELHVHPSLHHQSLHAPDGALQAQASAAAAHGSGPAPGMPPPRLAERQAALLSRLHGAGCVVVSFLPPAAWLLAVGPGADLAALRDQEPDVRLAPYAPGRLRVSPELSAAVSAVAALGPAAGAALAGGRRLDALLAEREGWQAAGWLLGALRLHHPADAATGASQGGRGAAATAATLNKRGAESSSNGGGGGDGGSPPVRVVIEVHFPHLEPSDLDVLAAAAAAAGSGGGSGGGGGGAGGGYTYHPAAAASSDWLAPLTALSPPGCPPPVLQPDAGSQELLLAAVCPAALERAVEWLAGAPQVSWLSPRMASRLHNLVGGAIVQSGGSAAAAANASSLGAHPFWAAGIDGRGQIVGCGDSGLDMGNCFFNDPAVPFMQNVQTDANGQQFFLSDSHRKVRYYLAVVQDLLDGYGHGSHVAGTLVGSRYDRPNATAAEPLDAGTGQAPAARIAFMDLSRGSGDGVWTPGDLARSYFNLTYRVGARVHSDSWGSDLTAYDSMAAALDRFTWANQDFVSVVAAGNYGYNSASTTTVTSPAVAKNCIAAGATLSNQGVGDRPSSYGIAVFNMTATLTLPGGQVASRSVRVVGAGFGGELSSVPSGTLLAAAVPPDACSSLSNAGSLRGRVALVVRGSCYFSDKMRAAAAAGALGVLVYNDKMDGYFQMQAPDGASVPSPAVPLGGVPASTARWLLAAMGAGNVALSFRRATDSAPPAFEDVASYSSFGPTTDGRIKPDIVAPGYLLSAAASSSLLPDGQLPSCGPGSLKYSQGTSMATPLIAGSALLVRQYFTDGYYPDGRRNPAAGFPPSGALVKAVMLGGAAHLTGSVSGSGMPLEDPPSYRQGFGRLSLPHSLPLPAQGSPGWRLQVVDGASLAAGEQHSFCVQAAGGPLRITLAWYDWPGDPAASRALVNNLDLAVRAAGRAGLVDWGNGAQDAVNTVEQVWYADLAAGDVAISVTAPAVLVKAGRQPYALVVQGKFSGTLQAPSANASSPATCAVQLAVLVEELTTLSRNNATFYFSRQDGSSPAAGFECRLSLDAGVPGTPAAAYNASVQAAWGVCSSPRAYTGLPDGRYSFQVRVLNEQVGVTRSFTVDTTPPVTSLSSSLPPPPAGSSSATTPTDNATFTFVATDVSTSINFTCTLSFSNGPPGQPAPPRLRLTHGAVGDGSDTDAAGGASSSASYGSPVPVGQSFACRSPLALAGLSFGDYKLEVYAFDAAKNPETDPKTVSWRIRYTPNTPYARLASAPPALTANRTLAFSLVAFMAGPSADSPPTDIVLGAGGGGVRFEAAMVPGSGGGGVSRRRLAGAGEGGGRRLAATFASASWSALTSPQLQLVAPADGPYLVAVRPLGSTDNSTWALAAVTVDTTPPVVAVTRKPAAVQSDPRVTIAFGDAGPEGEIRAFMCRWLGPAAAPPDPATPDAGPAAFAPCAGSATANVSEGYWLFQVKGRDAAGNLGAPSDVPFRTDLSPPAISADMPPAAAATRLAWNYTVDDGPSGTGVVNVSCSFRWVYLVDPVNVSRGDEAYLPATRSAEWRQPCPSPARYAVQEGSYLWSLAASDGAGLRSTADFPLVIDFTPPVSRVFASALPPGRTLPARLTIDFASTDKPDASPSGVAQQLCMLEQVAAPPPVSPPPAPPLPPSPPAPPGSRVASAAAAPPPPPGGAGARRMAAASAAAASSPRILNGSTVTLGAWHVCDAAGDGKNVTYDALSTGFYTFRVRAVDRAGNTGNATPPYFFAVDASLPADGSTTITGGGDGSGGGMSERTKQIVIGVLILVGVLIAIGIAVGVVIARRRALRKRYGPPPSLPYGSNGGAANGIPMQSLSYANGNGHNSHGGVQPGVPVLPPSPNGGAGPAPGVPYYPPAAVGVPPAAPDPALAAALAASAAAAAEAERARAAAAEAAEAERLRRAIAASIEEDNLRRAMRASLTTAPAAEPQQATPREPSEQAAIDAAIAASLASAAEDERRRHAALRAQLQQSAQGQGQQAQGASPPRPPSQSLI